MAGELAEIRLGALELDGATPITRVNPGQEFLLRGRVLDLRPNPTGVYQVYSDISYLTAESAVVVSEVQRLDFSGSPVGGTFTLTFNGQTSGPITFERFGQGSVQAKNIEQGLNSISALAGNVRVERDSSFNSSLPPNRYYIRFINTRGGTDVPLITADSSGLTPDDGSSAGVNVIEYAKGVRSLPLTFEQAFEYNATGNGANEATTLFPDLRSASGGKNIMNNVGGAAPLFAPSVSGYEAYFVVRMKALGGGADGNLVFTNSLAENPPTSKYGVVLNGEVDPLPADKIRFSYGGSTPGKLVIPVNKLPAVTLGSAVTYTENAAPLLLASGATLTDADDANLSGGRVTVAIVSHASTLDALAIRNQGTGTSQVSVSGSSILYEGLQIATFTGGQGTAPLQISLLSNATVAATQALLRNITFSTAGDSPSTARRTLRFTVTDPAGGIGIRNLNVNVVATNDAPTLDPSPVLKFDTITEDPVSNLGTRVSTFVAGVTDPDRGALKGIAVTTLNTNGKGNFEYSLDGGTKWLSFGTTSRNAARLLPADGLTRIRFVPTANASGEVNISFRAWDRTAGAPGARFDIATGSGGTTSISNDFEVATLTITTVNDAPALTGGGTVGYVNNASLVVLAPTGTVSDAEQNYSGGSLAVNITSSAHSSNVLFLSPGAGITITGLDVLASNVKIASISNTGGVGNNSLTITFNSAATQALIQQLLRQLCFRTDTASGSSAVQRIVEIKLTDAAGAFGKITTNVNVT